MAQAGFFPYQPKKQLNFGQTMKKTKGGPKAAFHSRSQ
jgi:hypothetical protein